MANDALAQSQFIDKPESHIYGEGYATNGDLGANRPLTGEPIVIYYTRGQSGYGHFRAVE